MKSINTDIAQAADELLTPIETARWLCLKSGTLASWRSQGWPDLAYIYVGGSVRYRRIDVVAFLARSSACSTTGGNNE